MIGLTRLDVAREGWRHVDVLACAHSQVLPPIGLELAGGFRRIMLRSISIGNNCMPLRWVTPQTASVQEK